MKLHVEDKDVRKNLLHGEFGLEKEALRVTADGCFSHIPHPFPKDDPNIVRDFCENQTEINTGVHQSIKGALNELSTITERMNRVLSNLPEPEYLWPFSNPPYIKDGEDIPVAVFEGKYRPKTIYRDYLSEKYGRYKMTFSGIHLNYSFTEELLKKDFKLSGMDSFKEYQDQLYLSLAQGMVEYGWLLVALTSASPLLDGSFLTKGKQGQTVFTGMSSVRCSELGYWNDFIPLLDYQTAQAYAASIRGYIEEGWINAPSELYYPVRLKSRGENNLDTLIEKGINHIELRMFDVNPFTNCGLDERDVFFAQLLMIWVSGCRELSMSKKDQVRAAANFKKAAHFDLSTVDYVTKDGRAIHMDKAGRLIIEAMMDFYKGFPEKVSDTLRFEYAKMSNIKNTYAWQINEQFGEAFAVKALALAKERQVT